MNELSGANDASIIWSMLNCTALASNIPIVAVRVTTGVVSITVIIEENNPNMCISVIQGSAINKTSKLGQQRLRCLSICEGMFESFCILSAIRQQLVRKVEIAEEPTLY